MSKWKKLRKIHENSVEAYYEGRLTGEFSKREEEILTALRAMGKGTDREVSEFLEYGHKSSVQPRISELIEIAGLLEECGSKHDEITGKKVRVVRIIPYEDSRQLTMF